MVRHLDAPPQAQPATTLAIIGLIAAVAALVGCTRLLRGGRRYIRTGAELGAAVLLAAGVISTVLAGQKHLATIGVLDFLGFVLYLLTLRQLLLRPWQVRLSLTVVLATAGVVVTKCAFQYWKEMPNTIAFYEEQKAEAASAQPESARARGQRHDFEQRLKSRSVTGYAKHSNVLGSQLILFILAAVAVIVARHRERRPIWTLAPPVLIVLGAAVAMGATQSKGAIGACAVGLVLWIAGQAMAGAIARRLIVVLVGLGATAALGTGLFLGALRADPARFGRSIQFRSMYWRGAGEMIVASDYLGVGAGNFGRHFTRYKPVECPEEVDAPHSWPVRLAAEWGLLGLVGGVLLLLGIAVRLCATNAGNLHSSRRELWHRRLAGETTGGTPVPQFGGDREPRDVGLPSTALPPRSIILWAAGLGAIVFLWWSALIAEADPAYVHFTLSVAVVSWFVAFVGLAVERNLSDGISDVALGPLLPALCAGLIAFLLHTGIDLAMFNPGVATTFFALVAVTLAARDISLKSVAIDGLQARTVTQGAVGSAAVEGRRRDGPIHRRTGLVVAVVIAAVLIGYAAMLVGPGAKLGGSLRSARLTAGSHKTWGAYRFSSSCAAYVEGGAVYPLDATALGELGSQLGARAASVADIDEVIALASEIRRRDPDDANARHLLGSLLYRRYELGGDPADARRAVEHLAAFVGAYPTSPTRRLQLADMLEALAAGTNDATAGRKAAAELQIALDLESKQVYVSQPHRFGPKQIEHIRARIKRLNAQRAN
jgi:hypothetical protein